MSARPSPAAASGTRPTNVVLWSSLSALGVLLAGLVMLIAVSLVSWAIDRPPGATVASAARVGVQTWYLGHGVSLPVSWGTISVPPLLVAALIAVLFYRSGRSAVRAVSLGTPAQMAEAVMAMAITYTSVAVILTSVAYPGANGLSISEVATHAALVSILAPAAGMLRESGLGARIVAALPGPSYAYTRGALATLWTLGAMSALALACSLVINFSETSALTAALAPSGLGGIVVILISIAYLPNAMLLAIALGTGAGFAIGDGSRYSLGTVEREALPTFPLFSALPHDTGFFVWLVTLVPLVAGVVGAVAMTRQLEREHRTPANLLAGTALSALLVSASVVGVAMISSGGLGNGRLAVVGASPIRLGLTLLPILVVVGACAAFVATARALTPAASARRKRALAVIETTAESPTADAVDAAQIESTSAPRPVISTKLAMRRLARTGKTAAARSVGPAAESRSEGVPKLSPSASLTIVKRAQQEKAAKAGSEHSDPAP